MNQTFQNSAQVLSIGIFFTLMIVGLASTLPRDDDGGPDRRTACRRRPRTRWPRCRRCRSCSPPSWATTRSSTCSAPHVLNALSAHDRAALIGARLLPAPDLRPVRDGLHAAFAFAIVACLVAAGASLLRGASYRHGEALVRLPRREEQHAR